MDWNDLLNRHGDKLLLFARQWGRDLSEAEDFVQEGFVRFWRKHSRQELPEPVAVAYLFTAVRCAALDRLRSDRRRVAREAQVEPVEPQFRSGLDAEYFAAALARLPAEQREVVVLKIWGELTFQAIADVTGAALGTVTSRYRYALEALRRELEEVHERQS